MPATRPTNSAHLKLLWYSRGGRPRDGLLYREHRVWEIQTTGGRTHGGVWWHLFFLSNADPLRVRERKRIKKKSTPKTKQTFDPNTSCFLVFFLVLPRKMWLISSQRPLICSKNEADRACSSLGAANTASIGNDACRIELVSGYDSLNRGTAFNSHTSIATPFHFETPHSDTPLFRPSPPKHRYPWCWNPHFQPHSHIPEVG